MYIEPTELQCKVLTSIAVKGPENIQKIQLREEMNYPSTHRAIKTLEKHGLVWLSSKKEGPKSPQVYSLTPLGVVASIILCGLKHRVDEILDNWREITPRFIVNWLNYEKKGLEEVMTDLAIQVYIDTAKLDKSTDRDYGRGHLLTIRRNSLDLYFLSVLVNKDSSNLIAVSDVIVEDSYYREVWERWFSIQKLKMRVLEQVDQKVCSQKR